MVTFRLLLPLSAAPGATTSRIPTLRAPRARWSPSPAEQAQPIVTFTRWRRAARGERALDLPNLPLASNVGLHLSGRRWRMNDRLLMAEGDHLHTQRSLARVGLPRACAGRRIRSAAMTRLKLRCADGVARGTGSASQRHNATTAGSWALRSPGTCCPPRPGSPSSGRPRPGPSPTARPCPRASPRPH